MPDHTVDPATTVFIAAASLRSHRSGDLTREHQLDGLGFDSLDRIALAVAIERATGRTVPDLVLATAGTLGDLIDHLTANPEGTP
ncbi:acyl carrier protein [Amycolatopsis saalfeldensis]|uniref:acyl carrier protein n=1 Tax=Amycolatopsis saalfeldensis TaxID=394193 RepID=UPI000B88EBED|nr:acyl carrier protein [Amycolatopsis saalfeldensis]